MSEEESETRRSRGGFAAASTGGQVGRDLGPRDRDPPPAYDGENPEVTFRQYEKQLALWEFETEVPKAKRAVKMLRQLSGVASTAVDDLEVSEIACEDGVKNVLGKLREFFMPHLEVSLPRAFETAVYGQPRGSKESFAEYTKRMERAFTNLAKEGVDLPDGAKGYIMYRQASLNEAQDQRLLTWAQGKYGCGDITVALRRLDKVIREKDKSKGGYIMEETFAHENQAGNHYDGENDDYPAWEDEDDNYVFLAEGDLDEVMDEQDVLQALASYHDTRQALKDQRLSRGYFPGKGKGKVDGFQKGKNKGKRKVHIEQLKLRTRCRRCLQVGHWERECQNPAASQAAKAESRTFFVGLHPESPEFSTAQQDFWLRQFVKENRARQGVPMNLKPAANSSEIYMKRACMVKEGKVNFCGITTEAIEGVVDTAAEGGLIGKEPLLRLERELVIEFRYRFESSPAAMLNQTAQLFNSIDCPKTPPAHLNLMASLLQKAKALVGATPSTDPVPMEVGHRLWNSKVPLKNWRVVLDKIGILLVLAALQDTTEAWCLDWDSQRPGRKSMASIEDYYSEVIINAPVLKPLQSKVGPTTSASACVHPKAQLKGGGNGSSSYIVCRACHTRWAHSERSADIRKKIKDGPLSVTYKAEDPTSPKASGTSSIVPRTPTRSEGRMIDEHLIATPSSGEESLMSMKQDLQTQLDTHVQIMMQQLRNEQAATTIHLSQLNAVQLQQISEEVKRTAVANREQEVRQEKLMQMLINARNPEGSQDPRASSRRSPPPKVHKECKCGKPAEALVVKKEGPRKGRMFWKCVQRKCDMFEWIAEEDQADIDEVKTAASSLNPRRSKSPKREASAAAPMVAMASPATSWARVSVHSSRAENVPVVDVEEFDG
ncbi:Copia protein [Durusdinium trenchii]|uniref:Copia protein n=1 Tax=Durusdinium trenchii TaxID=1381693 RepID=A0ABP0KLP3_9DINO